MRVPEFLARVARYVAPSPSRRVADASNERNGAATVRDRERRLAIEVARGRTLQAISTRLISESTSDVFSVQVVDAAAELMIADAASFQSLSADGQSLTLLASRNFHAESAAFWQRVPLGSATPAARHSARGSASWSTTSKTASSCAVPRTCWHTAVLPFALYRSTPLRSRSGQALGMLSTHWHTPHTPTDDDLRLFDVLARQAADLLERALAHASLRESEERFRLIARTAPVMIWITDVEGQVTYLNEAYLAFTGLPLPAALGDGWMHVPHPDDVERIRDEYIKGSAERRPFHMEQRLRRHDGEYRWVLTNGVPRFLDDGSFAGYIGTAVDISERKLAEEALSTVSQRLLQAQEDERAHVARELHDDINQRLALLGWRLHELLHDPSPTVEQLKHKIADTQEQVSSLLADVQALSHRLHPARLEYFGLQAAAAGLCREVSVHQNVEVSFHVEDIPKDCPRSISLCLYRVCRRLCRMRPGTAGHSASTWISGAESDYIELIVEDAGSGFDPASAARGGGLGLSNMNERLKGVGGRLSIDSTPRRGTTVRLRVPIVQH